MTYLELVNGVLSRLREDTVPTLAGSDDVVVDLVKDYVNDAKRVVEEAHSWSHLLDEWTFATSTSSSTVTLTGSSTCALVDVIYDANGQELKPMQRNEIRKRALARPASNTPQYYAVTGVTAAGPQLQLHPAPDAVATYHVYGYAKQGDLVNDSDECLVPARPVLYMALALAARERGELGAQNMNELMSQARQSLTDEIARDASNQELENIWTSI